MLIDSRPETADDVAEWVRAVREMGGGQSGRDGQRGQKEERQNERLSAESMPSTTSIKSTKTTSFPEIAANGALALITVACSLLDRQMAAQEKAFVQEGGFTERLYRVRTAARANKNKK